MLPNRQNRLADARRALAMQRPMTSLIEREILTTSECLAFERENWVDAFVDYGHTVTFDRARTRANRGIATADGTLFWLVRRDGKAHGYHALADDPLAAVEEAERAWSRRRKVRARWSEIEATAHDLMVGRRRFGVAVEDAFASPLCTLGIRAFMRRYRIPAHREVSGRFAALLMRIEPQVGFVIHEAERRAMLSEEGVLREV